MVNKKMKSKMSVGVAIAVTVALMIAGCGTNGTTSVETGSASVVASSEASVVLSDVTAVITLSDEGSVVAGDGASVEDKDIVITSGGTFSFSGSITEGRIKVEAEGQDVTIILNGVTISNSEKDAIYVECANSATIYVMEGTENTLTSGTVNSYEEAKSSVDDANESNDESGVNEQNVVSDDVVVDDGASEETSSDKNETDNSEITEETVGTSEEISDVVDEGFSNSQKAAIMAKCDLTICGSGALTVYGYINNGVQSKETLTISDVNLTLVSSNDGLKAGTELNILCGTFDIDSYGDAIQSDGTLTISDGYFDLFTGNGSASVEKKSEFAPGGGFGGMFDDMGDSSDSDSNSVSQKAVKAEGIMTIDGGTFIIDSADDAIHGTSDVVINGCSFTITTGDDGVHSDINLVVNGGTITVEDSYEGIEAGVITINDGEISVQSSDDGFNASTTLTDPEIIINGGNIYVNADGDGIDSNKNIIVNGGTLYVDGPSEDMNSAIDIGSENQGIFVVNGGTVTAVGSSGMLENADETSTQQTITYVFDETLEAGTTITISDSTGKKVASMTLAKTAKAVTYSSSELVSGETYTFTAGDQTGEITADTINATNSTGGFGMGGGPGKGGRGMNRPSDENAPTGEAPSDVPQNSAGN